VSAASFLGVAASVYASGIDGAWQAVGFAAGFVPVVLFVAAPVRRFGDRSLSDFLGRRFKSERVRISAVVVVEMVILIYLVPQAVGGGIAWDLLVHSSLPGLDGYESGIVVSTLVIRRFGDGWGNARDHLDTGASVRIATFNPGVGGSDACG